MFPSIRVKTDHSSCLWTFNSACLWPSFSDNFRFTVEFVYGVPIPLGYGLLSSSFIELLFCCLNIFFTSSIDPLFRSLTGTLFFRLFRLTSESSIKELLTSFIDSHFRIVSLQFQLVNFPPFAQFLVRTIPFYSSRSYILHLYLFPIFPSTF